MADTKTITVGGDRPISIPVGVRMSYIDELGRENVVFVPSVMHAAHMGDWEEQDLPVVMLSTQTHTLWSGAEIEWRPTSEQVVRVLAHSQIQERLRPLTLTVADLLAWARAVRDPARAGELVQAALNILTWLGRPPMTPQQHAEWTRKSERARSKH
jgi:hypothetical protein